MVFLYYSIKIKNSYFFSNGKNEKCNNYSLLLLFFFVINKKLKMNIIYYNIFIYSYLLLFCTKIFHFYDTYIT